MAATPLFGGTNSVPELDVGQAGSTWRSGGHVEFVCQVIEGLPQDRSVLQSLPQQDIAFFDRMGSLPKIVTWQGTVWVENTTYMAALRSRLTQYRTGRALDSTTGALGTFNGAYLGSSILKDAHGKALASEAALRSANFTGPWERSGKAGFAYRNGMVIIFQVLG